MTVYWTTDNHEKNSVEGTLFFGQKQLFLSSKNKYFFTPLNKNFVFLKKKISPKVTLCRRSSIIKISFVVFFLHKKEDKKDPGRFTIFFIAILFTFREAKFKTSLRVGFFFDFRKKIFFSRIKKSLYVILNISIESYKFLFWHKKKSKSDLWYFCGKQINKIQFWEILCVCVNKHKIWNLRI